MQKEHRRIRVCSTFLSYSQVSAEKLPDGKYEIIIDPY